jgi:hypothetical protein
MTEPGYHRQPHTQDPNVEIPEEAPLAQGHNTDLAGEVKAASEEHAETVQAEREDVGPRAPGDHAGQGESSGTEGEVPDGTVDEVKEWVGDDPDRAQQALDAENAKASPRSSLVAHLTAVAEG